MKNRTGSKKLTTSTARVFGRQKSRKGHSISSGSEIVTDLCFRPLAWAVAVAAGGQMLLAPGFASADQIKTDGRTKTTLEIQGNVTDVRTGTIRGVTAFNSFSKFDVYRGNVVNLHVPGKAQNLLNVVNSADPSHIDGVLNSIKNGGIGGNVYIANTAGVVIGAEGQVNVGALTVVTPTREVMDGFFDAAGNPSDVSTQAIIDRTVAISPEGHVTVKGKINAKGNVNIAAGSVTNSGVIQSGAVYAGNAPDFSDIVNVADLETGTRISVENGDIEIVAESDITNTGIIATEGANNLDGGDIHLTAGNDIAVSGNAKITASGHSKNSHGGNVIIMAEKNSTLKDAASIQANAGATGDGGFVEFSAKDTVYIQGGAMQASAADGAAGTVLIDPENINWTGTASDVYTHGTNYVLEADNQIVLDDVSISTRQIAGADARANHLNAASTGNSGDITLKAKSIELKNGTRLLADAAGSSFAAGNVSLKAEEVDAEGADRSVSATVKVENSEIRGKDITLSSVTDTSLLAYFLEQNPAMTKEEAQQRIENELQDDPVDGVGGLFLEVKTKAVSNTKLYGAKIDGSGDVSITASAGGRSGFDKTAEANVLITDFDPGSSQPLVSSNVSGQNITVDSKSTTSLSFDILGQNTPLADLSGLPDPGGSTLDFLNESLFDMNSVPVVSLSTSKATVEILGASQLQATDDLKISSTAISAAKPTFASPFLFSMAWGESDVDSSVLIGGTSGLQAGKAVSLKAASDVEMEVVSTVTSPGVDVTFVVSKNDIKTSAVVEYGTTTTAEEISVEAKTDAELDTNATATLSGGSGGAIAVAVSFSNTETVATLGGDVTASAGDVNVKANADFAINRTAASASSKGTPSFIEQKLGLPKMKANLAKSVLSATGGASAANNARIDSFFGPSKLNIAGSVAYADSQNIAKASIAPDAVVKADGNINVKAKITDRPTESADAAAKAGGSAVGGSVLLGKYINNADAYVGKNAVVDARKGLYVDAQTYIPYPWQINWSDPKQVLEHLTGNILDLVFTTHVINSASGGDGIGLAAAVSVFALENNANAYIDEGAAINTVYNDALAKDLTEQSVSVTAKNEVNSVNAVGILSKKVLGSQGGKAGIGGSVNIMDIKGTAVAGIRDDADVRAKQTVDVNASTVNQLITITEAGGSSDKVAIDGAVSMNTINNRTEAYVDDKADIDAGKNITIKADGELHDLSIAGGVVTTKGPVGIGLSVSLNTVKSDVLAYIGNANPDDDSAPATGEIRTGENLAIEADATTDIGAYSVVGAVATNASSQTSVPADAGETQDGSASSAGGSAGKGKFGIAVSGDASVNEIDSDTLAAIKDGAQVKQAKDATLTAKNDLDISALSGAVSVSLQGDGNSIAGSYSQNTLLGETSAYVKDASMDLTGDLSLDAKTTGDIRTLSASLAGTKGKVGVAGSVSINKIDNATKAYLSNVTLVVRNALIKAQDLSAIKSIAGALGFGGKAGVGLSFAWNELDNETWAYVEDSDVDASGSVTVDAKTDNSIDTISAAIGASKEGMAGAGAVSINSIDNSTSAYIDGKKTAAGLDAGTGVSVKAADDSDIFAVAGSIGASAGSAGIGAAVAWSDIGNTVDASIKGGADINNASGDVKVEASADSGVLAIAAGGAASKNVALAGSFSAVETSNNIKAGISGASVVTTPGKVSVTAKDTSEIDSIAGSVALSSGQAAIGVAAAYNVIDNNTEASVDSATVSAGNVDVIASEDSDIMGIAAGGAAANNVAVAGSLVINTITNDTKVKVNNSAVTTTGGTLLVKAEDTASISSGSGVIAGSGTAAVGAAGAYNDIGGEVSANISGGTANGNNVIVKADHAATIDAVAVAGAVSGNVGVAGSIAVNTLGSNTSSSITNGANIVAQNNVGVLAESDDRVTQAAGSIGVGISAAGVGASFAVNYITGTTKAFIDGVTTSVTALAKNAADQLAVYTGRLTAGVDLAKQVDLATYGELDLKSKKEKENITGVAVNASSSEHIENIGANIAGGTYGGVGGVFGISVVGGSTEAYVNGAQINAVNTGAGAGQKVAITASNIAYDNSFVGNVSVGAVAGGVSEDLHTISRATKAYADNGSITARNNIGVKALATQGVSSVATGGAAGGVAAAGTLSLALFSNTTDAHIDGTVLNTAGLDIRAYNTNNIYQVGGTVAGGGAAGVGGTFVVASSDSTTTAYLEDSSSVQASGTVNVTADNATDIHHISATVAGGGAYGVAGMASINLVTDKTNAYVKNSDIASGANRAAAINIKANHNLAIDSKSGALGVGLSAVGVGAGASVNIVKAQTTAVVENSDLYSSGRTSVTASSIKDVDATAMTAGIGSTAGIGGAAVVTLVGDDVRDEGADEVSGTLVATNALGGEDRFSQLDGAGADSSFSASDRSTINAATHKNVTNVSSGAGGYTFRTAAEVKGSSTINAGSIDIDAKDKTDTKTLVGGFGVGALGLGGGVAVTTVKANVAATVAQTAGITSSDAITVNALADNDNGKTVDIFALAGGAGLVGLGAAVGYADVSNHVDAYLANGANATGANVTVTAADNTDVTVDAKGAAAGAAAVGVVISDASKSSTVNASIGGTVAASGVTVAASNGGKVEAISQSAAGGILAAGNGAQATADEAVTVNAYSANNSTFNLGSGTLAVNASSTPQVSARADGVSVSGGLNVGVSIADASVNEHVNAYLGSSNMVNAGNLTVSAKQLRNNGAETAKSNTFAAGGGLLVGISATNSRADATIVLNSHVGSNSTLNVTGTSNVTATGDSKQHADVDGYNGGMLAVGFNDAYATSNTQTLAYLDAGVTSNQSGATLNVSATGTDDNYADATSGAGGIISGAGANATTYTNSVTKAYIGDPNASVTKNLTLKNLAVTADHISRFNGKVNSTNASLFGGSGAYANNTVNSTVQANLGSKLNIVAETVDINANNRVRKDDLPGDNVVSGSGGVVDLPATRSESHVSTDTDVTIGNDTLITSILPNAALGRIVMNALNDLAMSDSAKLDSGGAVAVAKAESYIYVDKSDADITVGAGTVLSSDETIRLESKTLANVVTRVDAKTYGLAGAAQGHSISSINSKNNISLNGARLVSLKDVVLNAGYNNALNADSETRLWNKTAIPMSTSPEADGLVSQSNIITVNGYAPTGGVIPASTNPDPTAIQAQAAAIATKGDVYLRAGKGAVTARGYGRGTDLYRQLIADAAKLFGANISLDTTGGRTEDNSGSGLVVNGTVFSGTHWQQLLHIFADANGNATTSTMSDGWDPTAVALSGDRELSRYYSERIAALESLYQQFRYTNPDAANGYLADKQILEAKQAQSAGVSVKFYEIGKGITAESSNIYAYGDSLTGAGKLIAPGDTKIEIVNDTKHFLSVKKLAGISTLSIEDELGGVINFNGVSVSNNADVARVNKNNVTSSFSIVKDRTNSADPLISLKNTFEYAVSGNGKVNPEIHIFGDVTNRRGTIKVESTGSVEVGGNLNGKTIDIKTKGDFVKLFTPGFTHTAGDDTLNLYTTACPVALSAGQCLISRDAKGNFITGNTLFTKDMYYEYLARLAYLPNADAVPGDRDGFSQNQQWTDNSSYHAPSYVPGSTIAGGNVFISAEKLNINGLIQSGYSDYNVAIDQAKSDQIVAAGGNWVQLENDKEAFFAPKAKWNAATNSMELTSIQVGGGYIQLYGDIFSTGNGQLKVMDGYGHIAINNTSNKALTTNKLDTGLGAAGKIQITDTSSKDNRGNSLVTTITQSGGVTNSTSKYENTGDYFRADFVSSGLTDKKGVYNTREARRLNWVDVQLYNLTYVGSYETSCYGGCSWGLGDSLSVDPGSTSKSSSSSAYSARTGGMPPNGESLSQDSQWYSGYAIPDYRMDMKKTTSAVTVTPLPVQKWWTDTCVVGICVDDVEHIKTSIQYTWMETFNFNHSLNASKGINVEFIGHDTGSLAVNSTSALNLTNTVRNLKGTTTLSGTSINSVGANTQVIAQNLVMNATAGSIGSVLAPLKIDLQTAGTLTANATNNIALWEQTGDLNVVRAYGGASDTDTVWLKSDGDIVNGAAVNTDAVRGGNIQLLSDNGAIGTGAKVMLINTTSTAGDVSAAADGDIYLTERTGDLRIQDISALAGNVTLTALNGSITDSNANATVDMETQQALLDVAARAGLQGSAAQVSADSTIRAYNLARQTEYQKYWQMRQLHRDANGAYQYNDYDAGFVYQLTDADRTAFASRPPAEVNQYVDRQTSLYHTVYQRLNPAQAGDVAYDANYRYDVAAMDAGMFAKLTEGNAWTDSEILNRVGAGIFKDTPDTEVMIEEANVRGKNITMTASTGGIGRQTGAVVISAANPDVWTNAERLALVAADRSDVMIDWDAKTISINQKDDLDITAQAGSVLNANALNGIYIGSEADIGVARVEATSATADVRIKTAGSLINAAATGVAAVKGNNLTLEAGGGNLGSFTREFLVDQTAGGSIVARAKDDLYLRNLSGDMMIDQVYAGGLAKLTSVGAIKEAPSLASPNGDLQTDIQASRVSLKAATTIGEADASRLKYLDVATALGGRLDAVAPNGVYVYGSGGVLGLGDISSVNGEVAIDTFADGLTILGKVVSRNSVAFNVGGGILFGESGQLSSTLGNVSLRANGYLLDENADPLDPQRYGVKMLGESAINTPKGSISISSKYDMLVGSLTALKGISLSSDTGSVADGGTSPVNVTSLTGSVGIAGKAIDLKGISAGGAVDLQAGKGGIVIHDVLDAGKSISANTTGDLDINQLVSASGDVELIAAGDLGINNASTDGLLFLQAGTAATPGNITAGTLYVGGASDLAASGALAITGLLNSSGDVALAANGIALNNVTTAGQATLLAGTQGVSVSGLIDSDGDIDVLSNGNVDINSLVSENGNNTITSTAGDVTVDQLVSTNGSATVTSTVGGVDLGTVTTQGDLQLNGLAVTLDSGTAGGVATVTTGAGGVTILDSLVASADALVNAVGDITASKITSLNGNNVITSTAGDVLIDQITTDGNNTVTSTTGDVLIDQITADGNNTVTSTAGDVSIDQLTSVNGNNTVTSTAGDVSVGQLTADNGSATLTAAAGTVNVDALNTAGDLDVNAVGVTLGTGYVGGALDITAGTGGVALDDITVETAADINTSGNVDIVQQLTTIVGDVNLSGVGIAIENLFSGGATQLLAGAGGVQINGFLNSESHVDVTSGAGIALNQVVSNAGDITMSANNAIVNINASRDINVDGGNITLVSANSTLGQPGIRLVGRSTGIYDLQAATGIYFEDRSLNFNGSVFTAAGLVDLYVAGASSAKVAAPKAALMAPMMSLSSSSMRSASFMAPMMAPPSGTVHLSTLTGPVINFSGGSLIVDYINGGEVTLGATDQGGSVTVGQAFVSGSMTINADNINLPYVEYTGDKGVLPLYLSGGTQPLAEQVDIYVAPQQNPVVVFHGLSANNATVNADVTRLRFVDTVVGQVAVLGNRFYKAVVDNVHKVLYGEELQLFTQQAPFNLDFYPEQKFDLNYAFDGDYRWNGAAIIDYNPDFIVNEFSTENSATLLTPKMLTLNNPVPGSEWDGVLLETVHLQQWPTVVIASDALATGSCIANPSLASGDACTESVSAIEVIN